MESTADYAALCDRIRALRPALIGVEGFTGSGKSMLSTDLARDLEAEVIHFDDYLRRRDEDDRLPYADRLDYPRIAAAVTNARPRNSSILVEGICLREVLKHLNLSPDLFVYVKRLARSGLWHDGFHLEDFEAGDMIEENNEEPHRSDFAYHATVRPHERADLVFERIETDD